VSTEVTGRQNSRKHIHTCACKCMNARNRNAAGVTQVTLHLRLLVQSTYYQHRGILSAVCKSETKHGSPTDPLKHKNKTMW
jgi:hypothetical protein